MTVQVRRSFGFPLSVGVLSDVGRVRDNNEDSFGHAWLDDGSLFVVVADGMGGHEAGEVASGLAVQVIEEVVCRETQGDPRERLYGALMEANAAILEEGSRSGKRGMGTTAITAIFKGSETYIGLIGDSRLYQIRHGHLVWRTIDHTRVQMLVDQGEITPEEAKDHPEAGMLTRALGHSKMADGRPLEPDVISEPLVLEEGDTVVMCSDGCHDLIDDWEVAQVVAGKTCLEAAEALIDLACERGGHDNVTVAVMNTGLRATDYNPDFIPPSLEPEVEDTGNWELPQEETTEIGPQPEPKSNKMLVIIGVVGALLLVALVVAFLVAIVGIIIVTQT